MASTSSVTRSECSWRWMVAFFAVSFGLAWFHGATVADFSAHPDEGAHVTSGLMVRDYLCHGLGRSPMAFANDYYEHYPKVAIGHYPPAFYVFEAAWLLMVPPGKLSLALFMAAQAALFAWLMARWNPFQLGHGLRLACGLFVITVPLVQRATFTVMSDVCLSLACLAAAWLWARFMDRPTLLRGLLFGACAATAILTKASGLLLALVPPLTILLLRRWSLLRKPGTWAGAAVVALTAGPWTLMTAKITEKGMITGPWPDYFRQSVGYFLAGTWRQSALLAPLALLGAAMAVAQRRTLSNAAASALALAVATLVFYMLVPGGLEDRYLITALPGICWLAVRGVQSVVQSRWASWVVAAVLLISAIMLAPRWNTKTGSGFAEVEHFIRDKTGKTVPPIVLISSDPQGEGAAVTAFALGDVVRPWSRVLRGTKVLSESKWLGQDYHLKVESMADLVKALEEQPVGWIIWDGYVPEPGAMPHHLLVRDLLAAHPERFSMERRVPTTRIYPGVTGAELWVYRVLPAATSHASESR